MMTILRKYAGGKSKVNEDAAPAMSSRAAALIAAAFASVLLIAMLLFVFGSLLPAARANNPLPQQYILVFPDGMTPFEYERTGQYSGRWICVTETGVYRTCEPSYLPTTDEAS